MARNLRLDIDGNSAGGQKALEEAALAAEAAAKAANHLGDEFNKAQRDAASLDRQLLETAAAAKVLAKELSNNPADKTLKAQLDATRKTAAELKSLRSDIIGDSERAASDAARIADSSAKEFSRLTSSAAKDAEKLASKAKKEFEDLVKDVTQSAPKLGELFSGGPGGFLTSGPGAAIGGPTAIVGTAAAGGLAAVGAGAAVAGAGVAGAALGDPEEFAAHWKPVVADLKAEFLDATRVFQGPGLEAIDSIDAAVKNLDLKGQFAAAVPYVHPLVEGAEEAAGYILDGVKHLTEDAGPAIATFSKDLPEIGKSIGEALDHIGSQAQGGADGLHALDSAIVDVVAGVGYFVAGAEAVTGAVKDASDSTRGFFDNIPGWVQVAIPPLALYKKLFDAVTSGSDDNAAHFGTTLQGVSAGADGVIGKMDDFGKVGGDALYTIDQRASDAAAALDRMNQAFDKSVSDALGLSNANIGAAQSFADLVSEFKKGADALDINTQKGRDNEALINSTIDTLERQREAAIAAGHGSADATAAANAAYNSQLTKLQQIIDKANGGKSAVDAFINSFRNKDFTITQHVKIVQTGSVSGAGVVSGGVPHVAGTGFARGGIRHAAAGLIVGPSNPGTVLFGEPQTGGEVLIPRKGIDAERAATLGQAAVGGYGLDVVPRGARVPPHLFSGGGGSGGPASVTVNFAGVTGPIDAVIASWVAQQLRNGGMQLVVGPGGQIKPQ